MAPRSRTEMVELRTAWAQAARVEAATRRAADGGAGAERGARGGGGGGGGEHRGRAAAAGLNPGRLLFAGLLFVLSTPTSILRGMLSIDR